MRVILVHGFNSSPEENFHPWLSRALRDAGFDVVTPTLHLSAKDEEINLHADSKINNELLDDYKEHSPQNINNISEERLKVRRDLEKAEFEEAVNTLSVRENKIQALKIALGIKEEKISAQENKGNAGGNAFSSFINKHRVRQEKDLEINIDSANMLDLFKSSSKINDTNEPEDDSFLLKFDK